jgi:hypothetical protein
MAASHGDHDRHDVPRLGQSDLLRKLQHRGDGSLLFGVRQISEWSGEVPPGSSYRSTTRSVIPVRGCMQLHASPIDTNQQFLDQQPIVDKGIHY